MNRVQVGRAKDAVVTFTTAQFVVAEGTNDCVVAVSATDGV